MDFLQKINLLLTTPKYSFLQENEHLKDNIILLTLGGSHAYGTNIESSDIDIRGICLNRPQDLIGLSSFEQVENIETDTTVYSFNKIVQLLLNCNPNIIELLGCKKEHYIFIAASGQELIDNKKLFLSKRAAASFGGYASAQLHRLQNNLARHNYPQKEKEKHIMSSISRAMLDFENRYSKFEEGSIKLSIDKSDKEDLDTEIFVDVNLKQYPLRDYKSIWSEMNNIVKDYAKINHRNNKKDDLHLNKHAMHLVRLYLMCFDILEKEEIITYRKNDLEFLMDIRNGKYQQQDGSYSQDFFDLIKDYDKRLRYAANNTSLPQKPDFNKIEEFVMSINKRVINKQ